MRKQKQPLNYYATVTVEVGEWIEAELDRRGQVGRRGAASAIVSELLAEAVRARKTAQDTKAVATAPAIVQPTDDDIVTFDYTKL